MDSTEIFTDTIQPDYETVLEKHKQQTTCFANTDKVQAHQKKFELSHPHATPSPISPNQESYDIENLNMEIL